MVMHKPGGTSTMLRERGFEETVAKELPGIQIVARQYGMADMAKARAAAENILTANPKIAGVFASSEASSLGAIQAISTRGLSGKVRSGDVRHQRIARRGVAERNHRRDVGAGLVSHRV